MGWDGISLRRHDGIRPAIRSECLRESGPLDSWPFSGKRVKQGRAGNA